MLYTPGARKMRPRSTTVPPLPSAAPPPATAALAPAPALAAAVRLRVSSSSAATSPATSVTCRSTYATPATSPLLLAPSGGVAALGTSGGAMLKLMKSPSPVGDVMLVPSGGVAGGLGVLLLGLEWPPPVPQSAEPLLPRDFPGADGVVLVSWLPALSGAFLPGGAAEPFGGAGSGGTGTAGSAFPAAGGDTDSSRDDRRSAAAGPVAAGASSTAGEPGTELLPGKDGPPRRACFGAGGGSGGRDAPASTSKTVTTTSTVRRPFKRLDLALHVTPESIARA